MQLVGERRVPETELPEQVRLQWHKPSETMTTTETSNREWKAAVLGTLNVLMLVLSARMIVLVSVFGAVWVSWLALQSPDPWRLGVLITFCLGVCGPAVWLASRH
jgi:hypothetical protein